MTESKNIAVFPGQGAQFVGMAKDLVDSFPIAKEMFQKADQALGYSLSKICFNGPEDELKLTANVQPAILTHSCIAFELAKITDIKVAAGHSLGEYSALVAAGALAFEDAIALVHKRGTYMQEAVEVGEGKMLAVLGQEVAVIEEALSNYENAEIANINAPGQIVVSGSAKDIDAFQADNLGFKIIPLAVSAPFHCALMQPAQDKLSLDLAAISINVPNFPVMSNFTAKPMRDAETIREALKNQVTGKVRWVECMENAISEFQVNSLIEFGPGNVLSGLMKRINKDISKQNISKAEDLEK